MNEKNIEAIQQIIFELFQTNGDNISAIDFLTTIQDRAQETTAEEQDKAYEILESKKYVIFDGFETVRGVLKKGLYYSEWEKSFSSNQENKHFLSKPMWQGLGVIVAIVGLVLTAYTIFKDTKESPSEIAKRLEFRPNIDITKIEPEKWLGDKEKFLTFYFLNNSKGPANNFSFKLFKGEEALNFTHSNSSNIFYNKQLTIKSKQEIKIPIAALSEFNSLFSNTGTIIDIGLNPEISKNARDILEKKYSKNKGYDYQCLSSPIIIEIRYKSIMGDKFSKTIALYVYIDTTKSNKTLERNS